MHGVPGLWRAAELMVAIMTVPWPISTEYQEECRYNTLLQISIGQEDVDEIISRDIHRTFPEHPQFGFEQGQQALFRVLKAYSLHDLEVRAERGTWPCLWGRGVARVLCLGAPKKCSAPQ
jgi:Rab-GTPase-TBC domain